MFVLILSLDAVKYSLFHAVTMKAQAENANVHSMLLKEFSMWIIGVFSINFYKQKQLL